MVVTSEIFYQTFRDKYPQKQTLSKEKVEEIKKVLLTDNLAIDNNHRNWIQRYYVHRLGEMDYVFYRSSNCRMVPFEELFDLIHSAHMKTKHGGRNVMRYFMKECSPISSEALTVYLALCELCALKKSTTKKGIVVKPILSEEMNSRCQIDLIDMQAQEFDSYRFIMVYQDHLTKYVLLRALKSKTAESVAEQLILIFYDFGAPRILHTNNGREFENKIIKYILSECPDCKLVHGKPRHPQSQGSVERANRDIEDMIAIWCRENDSKNWLKALGPVQVSKNRRYHSGIGQSAYKAMFGVDMKLGISDDGLTPEQLMNIETEDDLAIAFNIQQETNNNIEPINQLPGPSKLTQINEEEIEEYELFVLDEENVTQVHDYGTDWERIQERHERIQEQREVARKGLKKQAKKMLTGSNNRFPPISPGTSVIIPVPSIDRAKGDFRNVMGTVLSEGDGFYQLGTKAGVLPQKYARNEFMPTPTTFLTPEEVPQKKTTIRTTASTVSPFGGQGFTHCNCTTGCENDRCSCRKNRKVCNSKCHSNRNCKNIDNPPQ